MCELTFLSVLSEYFGQTAAFQLQVDTLLRLASEAKDGSSWPLPFCFLTPGSSELLCQQSFLGFVCDTRFFARLLRPVVVK